MAPYLPRDGHAGSPYSEGGALYALGLITANHGAGTQPFLTESLRATANPIIQHGACLGLGECGALCLCLCLSVCVCVCVRWLVQGDGWLRSSSCPHARALPTFWCWWPYNSGSLTAQGGQCMCL